MHRVIATVLCLTWMSLSAASLCSAGELDDFEEYLGNWEMDCPGIERCINHSRALYALRVLDDWGIPTVNRYEVADVCGNKLMTSSALERAGVAQPRVRIAFTPASAITAMEDVGYPFLSYTPRSRPE